jgi:hypothetical protein
MIDYQEPQVSICVLDFCKPAETRLLLESLKEHIQFPHKTIYLHNGGEESYGYDYFKMGLIDQFIQTKENNGLGIGTRDVMAAAFGRYTMYVQNDQVLGRDFTQEELRGITGLFMPDCVDSRRDMITSVSLAGAPCGEGIYSERAHIIGTDFYRAMEHELPLPAGGAGPYHHTMWREEAIQTLYKQRGYIHYRWPYPLFIDNGKYTIRDQPDGSRVRMRTDTKSVRWLTTPKQPYVFPDMTPDEWATAIAGQWVPGTIPEAYLKGGHSFNCWGNIES